MNTIILAKEGVFPITKDATGEPLANIPATGMNQSGTIQGEGKLAGVPSLFIRLSGCNLQCMWRLANGELSGCDTSYASYHAKETKKMEVDEIVALVKHNLGNMRHVVITGGEPLLQKTALAQLCRKLKEIPGLHLTMESNGSLFDEEVAKEIDLFSISPKLSNSSPDDDKLEHFNLGHKTGLCSHHNRTRINLGALQQMIDFVKAHQKDLQLKFVVGKSTDAQEIESDFLSHLKNWEAHHVMVMPLGGTPEQLKISMPIALDMAIGHGWRYTPRIHIDLFGAKAGV